MFNLIIFEFFCYVKKYEIKLVQIGVICNEKQLNCIVSKSNSNKYFKIKKLKQMQHKILQILKIQLKRKMIFHDDIRKQILKTSLSFCVKDEYNTLKCGTRC